jgi:hypothetical protein
VTETVPTFDAADHRFVNPAIMELEIREATGLSARASRSVIVRSVLESIVEGVSGVIDELSSITGTPMERIAVVGGGARISLHTSFSRPGPDCRLSQARQRQPRWAMPSPRG